MRSTHSSINELPDDELVALQQPMIKRRQDK
jgi:hypothetical protein